jgi:uncharacterized secreted protein with C-terminal beta-propeller domain
MLLKKRMLLAAFVVGLALFVNLALVNSSVVTQGMEERNSKINSEPDSLIRYLEKDYTIVKGEDGTLFLVKEDIVKERTIDSFEIDEIENSNTSFLVDDTSEVIKRFADFEDLKNYLNNHSGTYYPYRGGFGPGLLLPELSANLNVETIDVDSDEIVYSTSDYSTTNNQVIGVDEGDILKNDGDYAYIVSKDRCSVFIVDVTPPADSELVSFVNTTGTIREIYINDDTLVVLGYRTVFRIDPFPMNLSCDSVLLKNGEYYYFNYISYTATFMEVYDISARESPVLQKTHIWRGSLLQSRMIGDYVYVITTQNIYNTLQVWDLPVSVSEVYYFVGSNETSRPSSYHQLLCVRSINIADLEIEPNSRTILMRSSNHIFVSQHNIYITDRYYYSRNENTSIHRISIEEGEISYKAKGEVPGWVMSRFSMDEHGDYFRIATTKGWSTSHGVYVLDMEMNMVGSVEGIAPGERMFSARFMGNRAYLVTFRRTDPFFVINLTDPTAPEVLGELIIPGWSDYLHPYDENHVMGLGKEATTTGRTLGVKLSLFDVTNVSDPKEISKYVIGDSSSYTIAASDPHAFLFNKEKNLLVIPVNLNHTYNAAYVFDISLENGLELRDTIRHPEDQDDEVVYWRYRDYDSDIQRTFYIDDTLYTLSNNYLKMNGMDDLRDINILKLPNKETIFPSPPVICIEVGQIPR